MTNPGWGALLQGEAFDLDDWKLVLKSQFDPWVEVYGNDAVLRSASLDSLATANEVRDRSVFLIRVLNGAVSLSQQSKPIRFGGVAEIAADGRLHKTVFLEGRIEGRSRFHGFVTLTGPNGEPLPPKPSDAQNWAALAEKEKWLEDALVYFGQATDWFDIFKALECLECRFGGEKAFVKLGWASTAQIKLLKRTANWARRHADRKFTPPPKPMELTDARELVARLLRRAFDEVR